VSRPAWKKENREKEVANCSTRMFVDTFKNPRPVMTFANKGTAPFTLEQDRDYFVH